MRRPYRPTGFCLSRKSLGPNRAVGKGPCGPARLTAGGLRTALAAQFGPFCRPARRTGGAAAL